MLTSEMGLVFSHIFTRSGVFKNPMVIKSCFAKATLSRKIKSLEEFYGAQLLIRNTRQVQPTEIGRDVYNKANSILSLIEETQATISKTKQNKNPRSS